MGEIIDLTEHQAKMDELYSRIADCMLDISHCPSALCHQLIAEMLHSGRMSEESVSELEQETRRHLMHCVKK